jgi:hypothetical protein
MPTPEQSRLTLGTQMSSGTAMDPKAAQANIAVEQAVNRLPFFVEYDRQIITPAGSTSITSTSPVNINLTTDGLFYIDFQKYETWTDVKFQFTASGFKTGSGGLVTFTGIATDEFGVTTAVPAFAKFYFNTLSEHHTITGERRISDLVPGTYRLQFQYQVDGGTFSIDTNDFIAASITEMTPIPTF